VMKSPGKIGQTTLRSSTQDWVNTPNEHNWPDNNKTGITWPVKRMRNSVRNTGSAILSAISNGRSSAQLSIQLLTKTVSFNTGSTNCTESNS
jgi:hypothetical protein